ncbi:unnamed protein product, partial [Nesidiocoris tenuis]
MSTAVPIFLFSSSSPSSRADVRRPRRMSGFVGDVADERAAEFDGREGLHDPRLAAEYARWAIYLSQRREQVPARSRRQRWIDCRYRFVRRPQHLHHEHPRPHDRVS